MSVYCSTYYNMILTLSYDVILWRCSTIACAGVRLTNRPDFERMTLPYCRRGLLHHRMTVTVTVTVTVNMTVTMTMADVAGWVEGAKEMGPSGMVLLLVGNKCDLQVCVVSPKLRTCCIVVT